MELITIVALMGLPIIIIQWIRIERLNKKLSEIK